jgi:hypothetical protein
MFGKNRLPERVLHFSYENLRAALPTPKMEAADCSVCRAIGGHVSRLVKGGELEYDTIPDAVGGLRYFMTLGENVKTNWLSRCSECDRLYYCEHSYEYLVWGSEDYDSYGAVSPEEVLELPEVSWAAATGKAEIHALEDGTWSIIHEPVNPQIPDTPQTPLARDGEAAVQAIIRRVADIAAAHFARAGRDFHLDTEPTTYWFLFGLHFQSAIVPHADVLSDPDYRAFLRGLFAEIFDLLMVAYEGNPAYELAELYRAFGSGIECGPILPLLLPGKARPVMEEMDRIREAQYEEDRWRADQMGY